MFNFSEFKFPATARRPRRAPVTALARTAGVRRTHGAGVVHAGSSATELRLVAAPPTFGGLTRTGHHVVSPLRWSASDLFSLATLPVTPGSPKGRRAAAGRRIASSAPGTRSGRRRPRR